VIKPSKYFQMQKEGDVYTLRISEAFPEDEGVYKCIASNPAGDVTLSAELRVLGEGLNYVYYYYWGACGSVVVKVLCYKLKGRGFETR
jgi:hypothetical protein